MLALRADCGPSPRDGVATRLRIETTKKNRNQQSLKVRSQIKAGALVSNHNQRNLKVRSQIRSFPECELLVPTTTAHIADNDEAGVDAHAHSEAHLMTLSNSPVQRVDRCHDTEPGSHGALGVVLVSLRVAEIH